MASTELWAMNILKIIFIVIGAHIAITKVLPMLKDALSGLDKKMINGIISLFAVFILVFAGLKIFEFIAAIGDKTISYLLVIQPAFDLILKLEYYFKYIIIGVIVILGLKAFKKA